MKSENEKMFHIVIKDNSTGEIRVDKDTCCIMGAIDADDNHSLGMSYTNCTGKTLLGNFNAMMKAARMSMTDKDGDDTLFKMSLMTYLDKLMEDKEEVIN